MNNLRAGFGRVGINPKLGIDISGYFKERKAEGFLDDLEANALAISSGNQTMIIISIDNLGINKDFLNAWRSDISNELNIPAQNIIIASTHHTWYSLSRQDQLFQL